MRKPSRYREKIKASLYSRSKAFVAGYERNELKTRLAERSGSGSGCTVIGNAIPKSGTYLLNSILNQLGHWVDIKTHLLNDRTYLIHPDQDTDVFRINAKRVLDLLPGGSCVAAHLHYSQELDDRLHEHQIKHIFQYRDLRDVVISYVNYYTNGKNCGHLPEARSEQYFYQNFFSNDEERISYTIPKLAERCGFRNYLGWLTSENTCVVKFEDVYTELCECSQGFGPTLTRLFTYLDVDVGSLDAVAFSKEVLGSGWTQSSVQKKIGQYQNVFSDHHRALIDNDLFDALLVDFGYTP